MTDLTQRLPIELLAEILGYASAPDILRFKQVSHAFRDATLSSPLIQHKLDLYGAGLEYNPAAGIDLSESRRAFHQYLSNLRLLRPTEERTVNKIRVPDDVHGLGAAGGIYAIVNESVQLFTLGSASRGIPHKEWKILLPATQLENFGFYPGADVIAFFELWGVTNVEIVVHLMTLSSGRPHPAAQCSTILYSQAGTNARWTSIHSASISSSRLAVVMRVQRGMHMVIWDWKSAQLLFTLDHECYGSAEFIDDHRLLVSLVSEFGLPCIVLMDTEKDVEGAPVQTSFHLSPYLRDLPYPSLHLERGVHEPSPAEHRAPFHQDPTQRIAVWSTPYSSDSLVFPVEALLRLAEGREGSEIEWDEWKKHVVIPSIYYPDLFDVRVSGCRLFCTTPPLNGLDAKMEVYDFSLQGRVEYLSERTSPDLDGVRYLTPTGATAQLPWDVDELFDIGGGHDSAVFFQTPANSGAEGFLHIWSF